MNGEEVYFRRVRNGAIIGQCKECGASVKRVWSSRGVSELLCTGCGAVNPPLVKEKITDDDVVRAMKVAYETLTAKLRTGELDGSAFARVVEFLLGRSIPGRMWREKSPEWLRCAGLTVVNGKVMKA